MRASLDSEDNSETTNKLDNNEDHRQPGVRPEADSDSESDEDEVQKTVDQIIADIKASKEASVIKISGYDLSNPTEVSRFLDRYENYLSGVREKKNLLHFIADSHGMPSFGKISAFIKALVQMDANLLARRDEDGKTPLFCAVSRRKHKLVKIMCEAHSDPNSVLRMSKGPANSKSSNCLHEAILKKKNSRDDDLIKSLIELTDDDTLLAVNDRGLTPLHLAVEYERCDEGQVEVVEALVNKCDRALDKMYEHSEKGPLSPYLYLEYTYDEAIKKGRRDIEKRAITEKPKSKEDESRGSYSSKGRIYNKRGEVLYEEQRDSSMMKLPPERPRIAQGPGEAPVGKFPSRPSTLDKSRDPLVVVVAVDDSNKDSLKSPADKERNKKSSSGGSSALKPSNASLEQMKEFLRLYCLRNRQHDDAVEFLYGMRQDKQIYFDLIGTNPKITKDRIENGLNHLNFEDILQYVAIPQVEFEYDFISPKAGQRAPKRNGSGRADLMPLFNWLRDKKGVKRILRVIIEDLQHPAHSDEVIESCLNGMCVETWDWRKHDLSPDVLHKVAPDVRVVHLYWGGNNAILRAWSEAEGLKKLKKLKIVHLHSQQGLETRDRTEENIKQFKTRMLPIEVNQVKMKGGKADSTSGSLAATRDPYERHKWLTSMEEYADFLQTAERAQKDDIGDPSPLKHPITVALIDDGVDVNDQNIQSRIIGGRSFCHRDKEQNLNQSYYVSGGHGTAMARLICKVCPGVNLFILRLDEYFIELGKRQITAESATKAIRAAIERRVDIISMSWTIERTERNKHDIEKLADAVRDAASKGILMFCAATDQGAYKDTTYPAASSTKKIFKIGAAEASGAALKWLGDQTLVDFIMPGHQVVTEQRDDPRIKNSTALTGSSVATALASGLAAVILYTVQLADVYRRSDDLGAYRSLKNYDRMKEAFSQIGTTKESDNKYITVWNRFTSVIKPAISEQRPRDEWIDYITTLADQLMRTA
ncbi:hypothetical protein GGR51DRAFT_529279 [Nemania sp. FL0031]|nr:hypothetical protein GGR51DRAFT_529279 [Nemania sp. FL0031]